MTAYQLSCTTPKELDELLDMSSHEKVWNEPTEYEAWVMLDDYCARLQKAQRMLMNTMMELLVLPKIKA